MDFALSHLASCRLRLVALSLFFTAILPAHAEWPEWQADIFSIRGHLELLTSIVRRHPGLIRSMVVYEGNPETVLSVASSVLNEINSDATTIRPLTRLLIPAARLQKTSEYNSEKIHEFGLLINSRLERLMASNPVSPKLGFERQFKLLLEQTVPLLRSDKGGKQRTRVLNDFLLVAPLLYDQAGRPRLALDPTGLSGFQLEVLYSEVLLKKLLPRLTAVNTKVPGSVLREIKNSFMKRVLEVCVDPNLKSKLEDADLSRPSFVSLEEVPPLVALFRGAIGHDCSMLSVPLYPLLKEVRVFWLRRGDDFSLPPRGYILTVDTEVNGVKRPLILTVNGDLRLAEIRAAALAVNHLYGDFDNILVSRSKYLTNQEVMRTGLWFAEPGDPISISLPNHWDLASAAWAPYLDKDYDDLYSTERIAGTFFSTRLTNAEREQSASAIQLDQKAAYEKVSSLDDLTLFQRAVLALDVRDGQTFLGVTTQQVEAASLVERVKTGKRVTAQQIESAAKVLGLKLEELLSYWQPAPRAVAYGILVRKWPDLAGTPKMVEIRSRLLKLLENGLKNLGETPEEDLRILNFAEGMSRLADLWPLFFEKSKIVRRYLLETYLAPQNLKTEEGARILESAKDQVSVNNQWAIYSQLGNAGTRYYAEPVWKWILASQNRWTSAVPDQESSILIARRLVGDLSYKAALPNWIMDQLISEFPFEISGGAEKFSENERRFLEARVDQIWAVYKFERFNWNPGSVERFANWVLFTAQYQRALTSDWRSKQLQFMTDWEKMARRQDVNLSPLYYKLRGALVESSPVHSPLVCESVLAR